MNTAKIIQNLSLLSMEDLNQLSNAVQDEINPSFDKLEKWGTQKPDRYFEWVLRRIDQTVSPSGLIYHAALVVFRDGKIELYKGSSPIEIFAQKTALRLALQDLKINSKEKECVYSDPVSTYVDFDSRPVPTYSDSEYDSGPGSIYSDSDSDHTMLKEKILEQKNV
jgi:hypothetical protein